MNKLAITLGLSLIATGGISQSASAQPAPVTGEVMTTAANFCPRGWYPMNGGLLAISINSNLYAVLGTAYGGDGRLTFALPDTAGRVILTEGHGVGVPDAPQGQRSATGANGSGGTPTLALRHCIAQGIAPDGEAAKPD